MTEITFLGGAGLGTPTYVSSANPLPVSATFGGTVTTSGTASATPTPIAAGTGKSLNLDLFSGLFNTLTDGAGNIISPMTKTGGTVGIVAGTAAIGTVGPSGRTYATVAASVTNQLLGSTGAIGDVLDGILIIPGTTSPGNVIILDGATSITLFAGGATSVSNLVSFYIPLNSALAKNAGWHVTTGANVTAIATGKFT